MASSTSTSSASETSGLGARASLAILALVAGTIVATEVLLTRLLSLSTYYGLAFIVLSLAMLGLSAGSLDAIKAQRRAEPLAAWIARRLLLFAASIVVATVVVACVPLQYSLNVTSFFAVMLVVAAASAPMITGGSIVARILGESKVSLPLLYGVDLAAAAMGALSPLVILGPLSGPSALLALAVLVAIAAALIQRDGRRTAALGLAAATLLVLAVTEMSSAGLVVLFPKGLPRPKQPPTFQAWNALSHVELHPFVARSSTSVLWSPSPRTPKGTYNAAYAIIDGDAGTYVHAYTDLASVDILKFDATTAAHRLRPTGTACVIGVGGGRDLLAALVYGHDQVIGVEINPGIVDILHAAADRSPLVRDPRVRIIVGDGRAELGRPGISCRVLQATLVDTWAATSAGAFAHSEATIYTLEAWRLFLRRVEPDGVLAFSRWYDEAHPEETARLVALATASLLDRGVTEPRRHIALVAAANVATILVSPAPYSPEDLERIHTLNSELGFPILLAPDKAPTEQLIDRLPDAPSVDALAGFGAPVGLDTSAPTDDRPFFFQLQSASSWVHPIKVLQSTSRGGVLAGNAGAMFQLLITCIAVLLLGVVLLGPTLLRAARSPTPQMPGTRATVYFGALGAGFMMTEVALVQRMHVVLGHPSYALVIVLAALLLATGAGSYVSPRILRTRQDVAHAALVAGFLLILLPHVVIRPLAQATLESGLGARAAWAAGTSALVGLVLGMLFPSGMRFVSRETGAPLALAINGFTSIVGGSVAIVVSVWADIPTTFAVAGLIYVVAALAGPAKWSATTDAITS